ncbi:MAG: hypothetical protein L0338_05105 [Acidobacteria bacterium]|nr:hypothetical protein [Acidobacteriota bacterium]
MRAQETRLLIILLLVSMMGCQKQRQDNKAQMMLDSEVSGKNVMVIRPKEALRPDENVSDFRERPNIMQYDVDASQRVPSKEIVYINRGESVRPSEKKR